MMSITFPILLIAFILINYFLHPQKYLFLAVKTRGMNQNEVFYFQTVEIQWFAKGEINCDYLLVSVFVRNFANELNRCYKRTNRVSI